jgi:hypothetical protein
LLFCAVGQLRAVSIDMFDSGWWSSSNCAWSCGFCRLLQLLRIISFSVGWEALGSRRMDEWLDEFRLTRSDSTINSSLKILKGHSIVVRELGSMLSNNAEVPSLSRPSFESR